MPNIVVIHCCQLAETVRGVIGRDEAMNVQAPSIPAVAESLWAAHFAMIDRLHQAQGDALDALGLGPRECDFQLISSGPNWRLRAYGGPHAAPLLLVVPA